VYDEAAQLGFGLSVATQKGYDLERGRLDKTHHPFCTKFAAGDVRITTRVRESDIRDALSRRCTRPDTRCTRLRRERSLQRDTARERRSTKSAYACELALRPSATWAAANRAIGTRNGQPSSCKPRGNTATATTSAGIVGKTAQSPQQPLGFLTVQRHV
jgi:hypothetical protein